MMSMDGIRILTSAPEFYLEYGDFDDEDHCAGYLISWWRRTPESPDVLTNEQLQRLAKGAIATRR